MMESFLGFWVPSMLPEVLKHILFPQSTEEPRLGVVRLLLEARAEQDLADSEGLVAGISLQFFAFGQVWKANL